MTSSDLEWLSKIFSDKALRGLSATAELLVQSPVETTLSEVNALH